VKRANPHIPTGAAIIRAGGVLHGKGERARYTQTVGPYSTATGGRGYLVAQHGGSDYDRVFSSPEKAMREFTTRVGRRGAYQAIQHYQMKQGQRVGVQVRPVEWPNPLSPRELTALALAAVVVGSAVGSGGKAAARAKKNPVVPAGWRRVKRVPAAVAKQAAKRVEQAYSGLVGGQRAYVFAVPHDGGSEWYSFWGGTRSAPERSAGRAIKNMLRWAEQKGWDERRPKRGTKRNPAREIPPRTWLLLVDALQRSHAAGQQWVAAGRPRPSVLYDTYNEADRELLRRETGAGWPYAGNAEQRREWDYWQKHYRERAKAEGMENPRCRAKKP